jgi:predicted dehydrogenase
LELESVHYLSKCVAGTPLQRPVWWFDPAVAGEGLTDVGTHLVDLSLWLLFPDQPLLYRADMEVLEAERWPTAVDRDSFREITGRPDFPPELAHLRDGGHLTYWGNGTVLFRLRDRFVRFTARWGVRADGSDGDTHLAIARGSRATVTVRHDPAFGLGPQVLVTPSTALAQRDVRAAVDAHCRRWSKQCPGYEAVDSGEQIHIRVPEAARTGHESHFASVLGEFVTYFRDRSCIPRWEWPNLLAKYYLTTRAVELARTKPPRP